MVDVLIWNTAVNQECSFGCFGQEKYIKKAIHFRDMLGKTKFNSVGKNLFVIDSVT